MLHKKPGLLFIFIIMLACGWSSISVAKSSDSKVLRMATTTSTENSGLLRYLLPYFTKDTGYDVHVIAVGTGKALRMGQDGDVDVVLVHAPPAEARFVAAGYGEKRYPVMYNDFVILGPKGNPAHLAKASNIEDAMKRIASSGAVFVSRGDDSGTNKKEIRLWKAAGIKPHGSWYRAAGQGMGKVIQMADELNAYTLSDRGTWLAFQAKTSLKIDYQGDKGLFNPYGVIAVSKKRYPDINHKAAQTFINWIISKRGQKLIGEYRIHDTQLFTPDAQTAMAKK